MKQAVQATILGQQYTLRSDSAPEDVARVVAFVNEKLSEVAALGRVVDTANIAVLALLNVSATYLQLRDGLPAEGGEVESRLQRLLERIERACPDAEAAPEQ